MKCPHCNKEFVAENYGLIDCPMCGKPVFNRRPSAEVPIPAESEITDNSLKIQNNAADLTADDKGQETAPSEPNDDSAHLLLEVAAEKPAPVEKNSAEPIVKSSQPLQEEKPPVVMVTPDWENSEIPLWRRFFPTVRNVLFFPNRFFGSLPDTYSNKPLKYGYILWFIYFAVTFGTQYFMLINEPSALLAAVPNAEKAIIETFGSMEKLQNFVLLLFAATPFWAMLPTYLFAIVLQSFFWLLRIDNFGYFHTLRLVSYSSTVLLLAFIPPLFGAAVFVLPAIMLVAIVSAYRLNYLLALPIALMTFIGGGALVLNLVMGITHLIFL